jgi:hypothetical protein
MVMVNPMAQPMTEGWEGDNPFFLTIVVAPTLDGPPSFNTIDLDHPGWIASNADIMRSPGYWALFNKQDVTRPLFVIWVTEGDQPYYSKRHVGVTGGAGGNEIAAYGIGKKCGDGSMVRLWAMPDGTVCGGDDVDIIGIRMVHMLGPAQR